MRKLLLFIPLLFGTACDPVGNDMTAGGSTSGSPPTTTSTATTDPTAADGSDSGVVDSSSGEVSPPEFPEYPCPNLFDPDLTCIYVHQFRRRGALINTPTGQQPLSFPMVSQAYDEFDNPIDLSCALPDGTPVDLSTETFDIGTIPTSVLPYPLFPSIQTNAESIQALYGCDPIDTDAQSLTWISVRARLAKSAFNECVDHLETEYGCPINGENEDVPAGTVWADRVCRHYLSIPYSIIMETTTQPLRWHNAEGLFSAESADINSGAVVIDTLPNVLECSKPE